MLITVFTPAYNRAHLLPRLYESLCKQTFKDFEWLIVDDGSSDNTRKVIQSLALDDLSPNPSPKGEGNLSCQTSNFPIRYYYQENGGKHRAINRGVKEAKGELFFIADSDDMLPPDALETVIKVYHDIKDDNAFAGVCGLDGDFTGKKIGSGLPKEVIDGSSIAVRNQLGVTGDMKEVFRTEVLKECPFPEIEGERFCPEVLLWNRIATKYKLRYFNQIIYLAEYQNDGISAGIVKARMQSPVASMMTYAELTRYQEVPMKEKVKAAINYWRFRLCFNNHVTQISRISQIYNENKGYPKLRWYWNWVMPLGYLMHKRDVKKYL